MMHGHVANNEAVITLRLHDGRGWRTEIEAVIDTGFTAYLTLPPDVVRSLLLPRRGSADFILADGRVQTLPVYRAGLLWHGRRRSVPVHEAVGTPLVGMEMLRGSDIHIRVQDGGSVVIEELID